MAEDATTLMTELPNGKWAHSDSETEFDTPLECVNDWRKKIGAEEHELIPAYVQDEEGRYVVS